MASAGAPGPLCQKDSMVGTLTGSRSRCFEVELKAGFLEPGAKNLDSPGRAYGEQAVGPLAIANAIQAGQ